MNVEDIKSITEVGSWVLSIVSSFLKYRSGLFDCCHLQKQRVWILRGNLTRRYKIVAIPVNESEWNVFTQEHGAYICLLSFTYVFLCLSKSLKGKRNWFHISYLLWISGHAIVFSLYVNITQQTHSLDLRHVYIKPELQRTLFVLYSSPLLIPCRLCLSADPDCKLIIPKAVWRLSSALPEH